jgi:hypothetical protein
MPRGDGKGPPSGSLPEEAEMRVIVPALPFGECVAAMRQESCPPAGHSCNSLKCPACGAGMARG